MSMGDGGCGGKRGQGSREGEKKLWLPTKDENEGGHQAERKRKKRRKKQNVVRDGTKEFHTFSMCGISHV